MARATGGELQTAVAGQQDAIRLLADGARRMTQQVNRVAKLLGTLAQFARERFEDHEARIAVLEAKAVGRVTLVSGG